MFKVGRFYKFLDHDDVVYITKIDDQKIYFRVISDPQGIWYTESMHEERSTVLAYLHLYLFEEVNIYNTPLWRAVNGFSDA